MVMKAYAKLSYGQTLTIGNQGNNNVTNRVVSSEILGGVESVSGARTSPHPHAFSKTKERRWVGATTTGYSGTIYQTTVSGVLPDVFTGQGYYLPVDSTAENIALGRMYDKLRGSVDLSVDLVQWKKTIAMLSLYRRFVNGVAKSAFKLIPRIDRIDQIKRDLADPRLSRRRAKRLTRELNGALNTLAQMRLEYVYGWSPTMGTIHELAEGAILTDEPGLLKVEGSGKTTNRKIFEVGGKPPVRYVSSVSTRVRVVCYFNPRPNLVDALSKISSLNPVSILYEATPFSFVLDWITDISGWIRTLETAFVHRNEFVSGYKSSGNRFVVEGSRNGRVDSQGQFTEYKNWKGTVVTTTFRRTMLRSVPFPMKPVRQLTFNIDRQLNAIALAKATFLKADRSLQSWRR